MKTITNEQRIMENGKWMSLSLFLFLFSFFISFAGCSSDDLEQEAINPPAANGGDITFTIGFAPQVQTRVATDAAFGSTWEKDDAIGLFAVKRAANNTTATLQATGNYMHNVKLTYDGTKWTGAAYYANDGDVLDFYAYYPYIDNANIDPTEISFAVQTDQSGTAYNKSDLLMANKVEGIANDDVVTLQFKHMLSLVQVETKEDRVNKNIGPAGTMTVLLRRCEIESTLNLAAGTATAKAGTGTKKDIQMQAFQTAANTFAYRALVPAQTISKGENILNISQFNDADKILYNHLSEEEEEGGLRLEASKAKRIVVDGIPYIQSTKIIAKDKTFQMGETGYADPVHGVTLKNDFYMSKYEITNGQYAAFLNAEKIGDNGQGNVTYYYDSFTSPVTKTQTFIYGHPWGVEWDDTDNKWVSASGKDNFPVINVTWFGAKAYADWLGGSLPTEAQWEYACRATTTSPFSFGDNATDMDEYGWSWENSSGSTKAVGLKKANPWGLYDMHGNVLEWCSDWYDSYASGAVTDPTGPISGRSRVLRGGSWDDDARYCRSAYRHSFTPGNGYSIVGFRVVFPLSSL